jgi:hypothetical protein
MMMKKLHGLIQEPNMETDVNSMDYARAYKSVLKKRSEIFNELVNKDKHIFDVYNTMCSNAAKYSERPVLQLGLNEYTFKNTTACIKTPLGLSDTFTNPTLLKRIIIAYEEVMNRKLSDNKE